MAAVAAHDLEGIVAKRKRDPYRRGVSWWKIKNPASMQADDGRGELLNPVGRFVHESASRFEAARCKKKPGLGGHAGLRGRSADLTPSRHSMSWPGHHDENSISLGPRPGHLSSFEST